MDNISNESALFVKPGFGPGPKLDIFMIDYKDMAMNIVNYLDNVSLVRFRGACKSIQVLSESLLSVRSDYLRMVKSFMKNPEYLACHKYKDIFIDACRKGDEAVVRLILSPTGPYCWNEKRSVFDSTVASLGGRWLCIGLSHACWGGHIHIVNLLIARGANKWSEALDNACQKGHLEIAKVIIDSGSADYERDSLWKCDYQASMIRACRGGNIELVKLMIELGNSGGNFYYGRIITRSHDWNEGLCQACEGGHIDIVNLMIEKGANYFNKGLYHACRGNHANVVNLMIEKGAKDFNDGMIAGCMNGHINVVNLMIEKGANNWNEGLTSAVYRGYPKIAKLMVEKGANNFDKALKEVKIFNPKCTEIIDLLSDKIASR